MKKKILLSLVAVLMFAGILHAAGASSPITGFSWDNVRKVIRFMTSDGQEIQVAEAPKQYDMTVTGPDSWVTRYARGIPYRTANGGWRLKFELHGTCSSLTRTSYTVSISGVVFSGSYYQPVVGMNSQAAINYTSLAFATDSSNYITFFHSSSATQYYMASGDVMLTSKPLWAD